MPYDPCWQVSSWQRGGGPARLDGIVATKILVSSAHWSQIKFAETEFGANRKMALTLKPQNGEYNRFLPQGACLPFIGNPGDQKVGLTVRAWRYGTKGVGVLNSLFCTVGKQSIGQCQVARYLGLAIGPGGWVHCPLGISW